MSVRQADGKTLEATRLCRPHRLQDEKSSSSNVSGAQVWSRMEGWPRKTGGKEAVATRGNEGTNWSYTN